MGKVEIRHVEATSYEDAAAKLIAHYKTMNESALLAQQITLHGALSALMALEARGLTPGNHQQLVNDTLFQLGALQSFCEAAGKQTLDYTAPKAERH